MAATAVPAAPPLPSQCAAPNERRAPGRVASLDIVRGAVMVLMAIDHVRVYAGVPAGGPSAGVFFTRWVTHFCAPVFVFLAGTAAYLYAQKVGSKRELAKFLVVRGAWLVLRELTVLRLAWTFNLDYANFTFAGVIWMIGWCMVLLAGLAFLPTAVVAAIGCVVVFAHNAIAPTVYAVESPSWLLRVLYVGGSFPVGGSGANVVVLYVLVPWIGVMALGYALGAIVRRPAAERQRTLLVLGLGAVLLFVLLRATGLYGDPNPFSTPSPMPRAFAFLSTAKYPASLQFLLMTLGPALVAMALLDQARGRVSRWLQVFGQVPFFYYVLHIPLIHVLAVVISLIRTPESTGWLVGNHPMDPPRLPDGYMWSLPLLYMVTAVVVTSLYFACRWYARVKAERTSWWLGLL